MHLLSKRVELSCPDKIIFGQTLYIVRRNGYMTIAPTERDIRMVPLSIRQPGA